MQRLINYAIDIMIRENPDPSDNPSQNPELHPSQNPDINASQNIEINASQNWELAPSQNPDWKEEWWSKFEDLIVWEYMNDSQKERCLGFLQRM